MWYHLKSDGFGVVTLPFVVGFYWWAAPANIIAKVALAVVCFTVQQRFASGPYTLPAIHAAKAKYGGRVALVTGSNQGIGFETAKFLYNSGLVVVMGCRSKERAQGAMAKICGRREGDERLHFVELDLSNKSSVKRCAGDVTKLLRSLGKDGLDYLINNAGMIPTKFEPAKQFENMPLTIAANALGPVCLTDLLLPEVKKVRGRIIVLSSLTHHMHAPSYRNGVPDFAKGMTSSNFVTLDAYGSSKMAGFQQVTALAEELKGTGVVVFAVNPGTVATDIFVPYPYSQLLLLVYKSIPQGSWTTLHCCFGDDLVSGGFYSSSQHAPSLAHPDAVDLDKAKACLKWMRSLCT